MYLEEIPEAVRVAWIEGDRRLETVPGAVQVVLDWITAVGLGMTRCPTGTVEAMVGEGFELRFQVSERFRKTSAWGWVGTGIVCTVWWGGRVVGGCVGG